MVMNKPAFKPAKRIKSELANVHFYMPVLIWNEVVAAAKRRGMSQGEFATQAFRFALDHMEEKTK